MTTASEVQAREIVDAIRAVRLSTGRYEMTDDEAAAYLARKLVFIISNDLLAILDSEGAEAPQPAGEIEALLALVRELTAALEASLSAGDSQYTHHTAVANCPACFARHEANRRARAALNSVAQLGG